MLRKKKCAGGGSENRLRDGVIDDGIVKIDAPDGMAGDGVALLQQDGPDARRRHGAVEHVTEFATAQEIHAEIHGEIAHLQQVGHGAEDLEVALQFQFLTVDDGQDR